MSEIKQPIILPCRKCGSMDIDFWHGLGTQAEMSCNDCGSDESIQVTDVLDYDVRYAPGNEFSMEKTCYPPAIVDIAKAELIKEWNIRVGDCANITEELIEKVAIAICPWDNSKKHNVSPEILWQGTDDTFKNAYRDQAKKAIFVIRR